MQNHQVKIYLRPQLIACRYRTFDMPAGLSGPQDLSQAGYPGLVAFTINTKSFLSVQSWSYLIEILRRQRIDSCYSDSIVQDEGSCVQPS